MSYSTRRQEADAYLRAQSTILTTYLGFDADEIALASNHQDCREATDFILDDGKVVFRASVRIRDQSYLRFSDEFTLRTSINIYDGKSELDKIKEGKVDVMLYGFGANGSIPFWRLINLGIVKAAALDDWRSLSCPPLSVKADGAEFLSLRYDAFDRRRLLIAAEPCERPPTDYIDRMAELLA